ncbi:BUD13 protein, partial [Cisticola juncidis]|nr:BUD13 protein [Cisticola juncidis]
DEDSQSSDISGPAKSATRRRRDSAEPSAPAGKHNGSLGPSPPRRQRHDTPDLSPPRRRQRHDTPDPSPPRRQRHDTPDLSPPRRRQRHDTPDPSPPRRQRHDTPDPSPPQRQRHDTPDLSPPRRQRHDTPDLSPPRRQRHDTPDLSPPRRRQRHDTPDLSPPRKRRHNTPDLSPARRQRQDLSPQREKPQSPSGKRSRTKVSKCSLWGLSPPGQSSPSQKEQHRSRSPPERSLGRDTKGSPKKAHTMASGARAGLVSAEVLQREKQELRKPDRSTKHLE